ncbi:MAG TPA: efflux RND transporter periplasmic adaptor subunit [Terriglobia bacterium]|nr:efflux RND transporter periplasmic adaptor subunit [Terriglobia bacterium]
MSEFKAANARWIVVLVVFLALGAVAIYTLRRPQVAADEAAAPATASTGRVAFLMEQQWLIKLKLAKAEEAELAPQIRSTGRVVPVPENHAVVAPPVGGIIQGGTLPRIGQQVTRGQRLATLLQTPTAAEAAQIQIENTRIDAERRRLGQVEVEAEARLEESTHDLGRSKRLYEKKAYSAKALEADELDRTAKAAQLEAVREQLKALHPVTAANTTYEVHAPISGTIVGVSKSSGEQVAAGEAILEIVALDNVWVEAPIFEKDLGKLAKDVQAVFTTAAFPDKEFQGRLVSVNKVVDEQSRAAKAIFEVPNATGALSIGMQANVRLNAGAPASVLLIPRESVLDNEGKKIVYVQLSGEEFERRDVVLGDEYGRKVAVLSGVKPGQRVVTQGAYQLKLQELRPANAGAHTHEV